MHIPRTKIIAIGTAGLIAAATIALGTTHAVAATAPHTYTPGALHTTMSHGFMMVEPASGTSASGTSGSATSASTGVGLPLLLKVRGHDKTGQPLATGTTPAGYSPAQVQAYLGLHGNGAGQQVTIVDAYDDPYITSDVNTFSSQFGLPLTCGSTGAGSNCFNFTVSDPDGFAGIDTGWGLETSLDVEMVHAIAPEASITLMEAYDDTVGSLFTAIDNAAATSPDAISNSWTFDSTEFTGETAYDSHCELTNSVCVFSSGDSGNPASYPATSPYVLAVGGTTLTLGSGGSVSSETAWDLSGGGISYIEPKPSYQDAVNPSAYRATPDVSFDADPNTGVPVYDSEESSTDGHWFEVGGTSVGAPAWSAILAVADQLRAQAGKPPLTEADFGVQNAVYSVQYGDGLYDITQGSNGIVSLCGTQCEAGPGYDDVTGLGSPRPGIDTALAAAP
jgi:subtilase family serine protease